jgi:PGF-CTERM protein
MKKRLVAMLITAIMLLALSAAEYETKSTGASASCTTPVADTTKSIATTTSSADGPDDTSSTTTATTPATEPATEPAATTQSTTTTSTTPGFEAAFTAAGLLAVTFVALRRRR